MARPCDELPINKSGKAAKSAIGLHFKGDGKIMPLNGAVF
jgi:hypothetical protein